VIDVKITRAEALLIVELVKKSTEGLIESLIVAVEDENDKEQVARAAKQNYVSNLESEVKRLTNLVNEKAVAQNAPHGLKKDGTPRAKPGRKTLKRKTRGTK
jgi:hypothetical protein